MKPSASPSTSTAGAKNKSSRTPVFQSLQCRWKSNPVPLKRRMARNPYKPASTNNRLFSPRKPAGQATSNQRKSTAKPSVRRITASRQLPRCSGSAAAARASNHAITTGNPAYNANHGQRNMCCPAAMTTYGRTNIAGTATRTASGHRPTTLDARSAANPKAAAGISSASSTAVTTGVTFDIEPYLIRANQSPGKCAAEGTLEFPGLPGCGNFATDSYGFVGFVVSLVSLV